MLVNAFARAVAEQLPDARLLLIGSRARGDNRVDSDYDFVVVSRTFSGIAPPWRGQALFRAWAALLPPVDVDVVCITPSEWERAARTPTSWLREAFVEAIPIELRPTRAA
jgi:predicted nucleotidyltransferase